jgi:predicted TIM-barrel fold metal-dependent hydrolase
MIIDSHAHLWPPIGHWPGWTQKVLEGFAAYFRGISLKQVAEEAAGGGLDPFGDKLVAEMDAGGVDVTLVVVVDWGLVLPGAENDSRVPLEEQFAQTAEAVKKHRGRLIWGPGIDPRRVNAVRLVEKAIKDLGGKVIKLNPVCGFYPNDVMVYPIYKKAVELGVPVQFHTQHTSLPYTRSKFSHPIHLEDVATDFPELKIQAVHSGATDGGPWWRELMTIAAFRQNIFLDVSAWQMNLLHGNPVECYRRVREMMDRLGPKRVMWSTDWFGPSLLPQARWLKAFQEIPETVKEAGVDFTEAEKKAFLGETAAEFLGLSPKKL